MKRRANVAVIVALLFLSACGGGTSPTPVGDAVNGVWLGSSGTTTMRVDIHSVGESGIILGSGTMTTGSASTAVDVEGGYGPGTSLSLHMVATNYDVFFTGSISGKTASGALQGSAAGFNGQPITLTKQ